MADFEYEQLKTLFENLGDRLDRTPGDQATMEELNKMRTLLDRMNKQLNSRKKSTSKQDHKEFIDQFFEQWKSENPLGTLKDREKKGRRQTLIQEERKRPKSFKPLDDELGGVNKSTKNFGSIITGINQKLNRTSDGLDNFMSNLKKGGILAAVGGGTGTAIGKVGMALAERTDAYRDLITSSEGSITSIEDMTNAANAAGMSARELADQLLKGSQGARLLGGLKFAGLTNALTKTTAAAGNLGLTFEKRAEATQDFLSSSTDRGNLKDLSQDQMTRGIIKLVKSSEETAHILGLTRDDALKAAKDRAADHAMNAIIRSMNLSEDTMNSLNSSLDVLKNTGGSAAENMLKQLVANGSLTTADTTTLAATDPELYKTVSGLAERYRKGENIPKEQVAQIISQYAKSNRNSELTTLKARLSVANVVDPNVAGAFDSSLQIQDRGASLSTDKLNDRLGDAGTRALLDGEEVQRRASSVLAATFDALSNTTLKKFGNSMENLALKMQEWSTKLVSTAESTQAHPTIMSTAAIGLLGGALAMPLIGTIMKGRGLLKGARSIMGSIGGATAEAGASGIGGATAEAGIGGASLEAGSGLAAFAAPAALTLGGLAVGGLGMYAGNRIIDNRKGESFLGTNDKEKGVIGSRGSGYLTSILAGAGGGALVGSAFGGVGAIPGAVVGGLLGLGSAVWSDWDNLTGKNNQSANGSMNPLTGSPTPNPRRPAANASGGVASETPIDQIMQRVMVANEASVVFLKKIKENSEAQVSMMKDELSMMRSYSDKMIRLLEENNTYTKLTAMNGS